ncbi:MAG: hypothetical protein E7162_03950 [Firmicutes bacterium]|nr:hypothetical protein [Bacillota bacterium]
MKNLKNKIIVFICMCILLLPGVANAAFNSSTGGYKPPSTGNSCPRCSWVYNGDEDSGVRISLYKYKNGTKTYYGSLDLINRASDYTSWVVTTTARKSRLEYGSSSNVSFKSSAEKITLKSIAPYNGGKTYELDDSTPWGPTFINRLSTYLGNDKATIQTNIEAMFGHKMNLAEYSNYYLVVEPTLIARNRKRDIKFYATGYEYLSRRDKLNDSYYTYSVSELTAAGLSEDEIAKGVLTFWGSLGGMVTGQIYNAMFVKTNEFKIFNEIGSYDPNNFVNHYANKNALIKSSDGAVDRSNITSNYDVDDYSYGITVLWLGDVLPPEENPRTCATYCADAGDDALDQCAQNFCTSIYPAEHVEECILTCKDTVYDSPGCDREVLNVCYNSTLKTSDIKSTGNYCAANGSNTTKKDLTSKICYDDVDNKNYTLESQVVSVNKTTGKVNVRNLSKSVILSYYKIECDEKVTFSNLPSRANVYVTPAQTSNLYLGYTMEYKKVCQIYYKTTEETWSTDYNKSKAKAEIEKYKESLKIATEGKATLEKVIKELEGIKPAAEQKLKDVKDKDQPTNDALTNTVKVQYSNQQGTTSKTETVTLEPVYCIANNSSYQEKYCELEAKKGYTINYFTKNVSCLDNNGNPATAIVNLSTGKSTYTEKVYYSLPSSYTGVNKLGDSVVCRNNIKVCNEILNSPLEIKHTWVFDPLNKNVSLDTYNSVTEHNNLNIVVSGMGSCGQFSFELKCGYEFKSSTLCSKNCIEEYNKPGSQMTQTEYQTCFKNYCSCDSYCGNNVVCRMKYCPQECDGCEDFSKTTNSCNEGSCLDDCNKNYATGEKRLTCTYGCCRTSCNGAVGCIYNCCMDECEEKYKNNYITKDEYLICKKTCRCENGSCSDDERNGRDYVYRTINLNRPFPDGDNVEGRAPGANWFSKVEHITESSDATKKYYDSTDGRSSEYEYRFVLTSEDIKEIKKNKDLNLTYTDYKESKNAKNTYEDATKNRVGNAKADVYCSYIIHDYFKDELGIIATSNVKTNKDDKIVGSGCYTR